jgi:hypothetical protein
MTMFLLIASSEQTLNEVHMPQGLKSLVAEQDSRCLYYGEGPNGANSAYSF